MTILSLIKHVVTPMFVVEQTSSRSNVSPLKDHPFFVSTEPGVKHLTGNPVVELTNLLPNLGRLTRSRKWVILVAPPTTPDAAQLAQAGIDPRRYLVINARSDEGKWWAVEQALRSGNCGAVLCWSEGISNQQNRRLEAAAEEGWASCFCLKTPSSMPQQGWMFQAA